MSAQSTDQPATLDGEVSGPDYAQLQGRPVVGSGLLNGTTLVGAPQSGNGSVPVSGSSITGSGATYGSVGSQDRSVDGIRNAGGVTGTAHQLEAAQAPQQSAAAQAPQQSAAAQVPQQSAAAQAPQQSAAAQVPQQSVAAQAPQQSAASQAPQQPTVEQAQQQPTVIQLPKLPVAPPPPSLQTSTQAHPQATALSASTTATVGQVPLSVLAGDRVPQFGRPSDVQRTSAMTEGPMDQQPQQVRDPRYPPLRLTAPRRPVALQEFEQQLEHQGQVAGVSGGEVQVEQGSEQFMSPAGFTSAQSYVSAQSQEVTEGQCKECVAELRRNVPEACGRACDECREELYGIDFGPRSRGILDGSFVLFRGTASYGGSSYSALADKPTASSARRGSFIQQRESGDDHG